MNFNPLNLPSHGNHHWKPRPPTDGDHILWVCGVIYLIGALTYIIIRVGEDRSYYKVRHRATFENCVAETHNFRWCYLNLTPTPASLDW